MKRRAEAARAAATRFRGAFGANPGIAVIGGGELRLVELMRQIRQLMDHDLGPGRSHSAFKLVGVEHVGDKRFYSDFAKCLGFVGRSRRSGDRMAGCE